MNIISREDILKEKLQNVEEGKLLVSLFKVAEELGFENEIELQNIFSFAALDFVTEQLQYMDNLEVDALYNGIENVYYVAELYLRKCLGKDEHLEYMQLISLLKAGKVNDIIKASHDSFIILINSLKHIVHKCKKKIPKSCIECFKNTIAFLDEIDHDLSICLKYPGLTVQLVSFSFGREYSMCRPEFSNSLTGLVAIEEVIHSLYSEISILAKLDQEAIRDIYRLHVARLGSELPFNVFGRAMNNHLFAMAYSEHPEKLRISETQAKLLLNEIERDTLDSAELMDEIIKRYEFSGRKEKYLIQYAKGIQKRIELVKSARYFGELFDVTTGI